jgi:hypothetical protein
MLLSQADRFTDLTIQGLPFSVNETTWHRLISAATLLEPVRPATGRQPWESYANDEPAASLGDGHRMLLQFITVLNTDTDWLEISLDVAYHAFPTLRVSAMVQVQCLCVIDHGMDFPERHVARRHRRGAR